MEKKLYVGFKKSEFTDYCLVQITMPSGDFRNVFACDMRKQDEIDELHKIFLEYESLNLNGVDVKFGPHGECTDVKYILHDVNGIITEIKLFSMTEEEFEAQAINNDKGLLN